MIKEIRFVLNEHNTEIEKVLLEKMQPFILDKDIIEENGDAGTTISIVFFIIQTAISIPAFIVSMHELICLMSRKEQKHMEEQDELNENSNLKWKIGIDGHEYDLFGLPSDEERMKIFNCILKEHMKND